MNFFKNFFDDESKIIGLCGFSSTKPQYSQNPIGSEYFFNHFTIEKAIAKSYQTNFSKNVFLI